MKTLIITTMRNEGAFLLEWLAHHRAVGVSDFLVYTNDCDDGTDAMLDRLQAMGWLTHRRNPGPWKEGPQWAALKDADSQGVVKAADWLLVSDVDEFVNIHTGDHSIGALVGALPDASAIALTWRFFGNAGVVGYDDRPVTDVFRRAAPAVLHWPWRAAMIKTLFRNDGTYRKLGVHRPRSPNPGRIGAARWFDGSGRELGEAFRTQRLFSDFGQDNYQLAQINHYALGAMESYVVKADRGRANREAGAFDMAYWVERNFSAVEDASIDALAGPRGAVLAELHLDPILGPLHRAAVAWRRTRFDALMGHEPWRALFGRLMMAPATRVLSREQAAIVIAHAMRARAGGIGETIAPDC